MTQPNRIVYNGKSKVIKRLCEMINTVARLGTTHTTAFYGDLGQQAYDHSRTIGNPHQLTLEDLGIENIQRQIDTIMGAIGAREYWISHEDDYYFIDHEGDKLLFSVTANMLKWH